MRLPKALDGHVSAIYARGMAHPIDALTPILETALDAVVVMRSDGTISGWNAVAEQVFGWTDEQAVGEQLGRLIIPEGFRDAHRHGLAKYLETGEGPVLNRHIEITALRRNGEEFPVELSITPSKLAGERVFLGFLRDISDRRAAEAIIKRRACEAEAIATLTSLAAETPSFEIVMERCLESVCQLTGWKLAHAFCCSKDDPGRLEDSGIWHNPGSSDIKALVRATAEIDFRSGVGLPGRVLENGSPVWITDVEQDPYFPRSPAAAALGVHAAFAFPVRSGARTIAVLEFFHNEATEPDLTLWPVLRTLGEQVGRVLERSWATELLKQERQSLLAEIARREELERHQQLLLNELNHRVKNTLAVVAGIAQQTAKASLSVAEFNETFSGRLSALAAAHSLLTRENWQATELRMLIQELLRPFSAVDASRTILGGSDVILPPKAVLALCLIVHELLTNALKYGALSIPAGSLEIRWETQADGPAQTVVLTWRERGLEALTEPTSKGFGTKLLSASVRHELGGELEQRWHSDGLELRLLFPLKEK